MLKSRVKMLPILVALTMLMGLAPTNIFADYDTEQGLVEINQGVEAYLFEPFAFGDPLGVGIQHLLTGVNMLDGAGLSNLSAGTLRRNLLLPRDELERRGIFLNRLNVSTPDTSSVSRAAMGRSIHELNTNLGVDITSTNHGNATFEQILRLSASSRFNVSGSGAFRAYDNTFLFTHRVHHHLGTNTITYDSDHIRPIVQSALDETFLRRLKGLEQGFGGADGARRLFNEYGSHFITGYRLGGEFEHNISATIIERSMAAYISQTLEQSFAAQVGVGNNAAGGSRGRALAIDLATSVDRTRMNTRVSATTRGGGTMHIPYNSADPRDVANAINVWSNTLTTYNATIQFDEHLSLVGIWELLPPGHDARFYELARTFYVEAMRLDREFFNLFFYSSPLPYTIGRNVNEILFVEHNDLARANVNLIASTVRPAYAQPISTQAELRDLLDNNNGGGYFYLTHNIALTGLWQPINNFSGTLDGQGFTISNLIVGPSSAGLDSGTRRRLGFFGRITKDVTIKNLTVSLGGAGIDAGINGGSIEVIYAGGLIAEVASGGFATIESTQVVGGANSRVRASIYQNSNNTTAYAGGFIGEALGCVIIRNSYVRANVVAETGARSRVWPFSDYTTHSHAGGFIGCARRANVSIYNSYVDAIVTANRHANDTSSNSYHWHGAFIGRIPSTGTHTTTHSHFRYQSTSSSLRETRNPDALTAAQLGQQSTFAEWRDFDYLWEMREGRPELRMFNSRPAFIIVYSGATPVFSEGRFFPSDLRVFYTDNLFSSYRDVTAYVQLRYDFSNIQGNSEVRNVQIAYERWPGDWHVVTFPVNVNRWAEPSGLRSVFVSTPPTATQFSGEHFNPAGMVVIAGYNDFTTVAVNNNELTFSPNRPLTLADREITITFGSGHNARSVVLPITVREAGSTITIANASGAPGSIVQVPVTLRNNPGLIALGLYVSFDDSVLRLDSATTTELLNVPVHPPITGISPARFAWNDSHSTVNNTSNGTILTLNFEILPTAVVGDIYDISVGILPGSALNASLQTVDINPIGGRLTVSNANFILGDVNNDGAVTPLDAAILTRYTALWNIADIMPGLTSINHQAANVTGTGGPPLPIDAAVLTRHTALWPEFANLPWRPPVVPAQFRAFALQPLSTPVVSAGSGSGEAGETIQIPVSIDFNPGIIAMGFDIIFDDNALRLIGISNTGLLNTPFHPALTGSSPQRFMWMDATAMIDNTANGEILLLTFEILPEAIPGADYEIAVTIAPEAILNSVFQSISFGGQPGTISVHGGTPTVTFNPTSAAINDANLSQVVNVEGAATGNIAVNYTIPAALQGNVNVTWTAGTPSVTITGTRPTTDVPPVTGNFNISVTRAGVTESFTVNVNLTTTYSPVGIEINPSSISFGSLEYSQAQPTATTVTLTNRHPSLGTGAIAVAFGGDYSDFTFTGLDGNTIASIAGGASATFTVRPNARLGAATTTTTHNASIMLTGRVDAEDYDISETVNVSFTVTPRTWAVTYAVGSGGGDVSAVPAITDGRVVEGSSVTFTATPATGYKIARWTVNYVDTAGDTTLTISNITAAANVRVYFEVIPTYGISVSPTNVVIPTLITTYAPSAAVNRVVSVRVANTGNQPTGALTVSGYDSLAVVGHGDELTFGGFDVSPVNIPSIAPGAEALFTIQPSAAMISFASPSAISAALLISNDEISETIDVSFGITDEFNAEMALSVSGTHTFAAATVGYAAVVPLRVRVTNTGIVSTGEITIALSNDENFSLSPQTLASIPTGGYRYFTVAPVTGLELGTFASVVTVNAENADAAESFQISFTVNAAVLPPAAGVGFPVRGGTPPRVIPASPYTLSVNGVNVSYSVVNNVATLTLPLNVINSIIRAAEHMVNINLTDSGNVSTVVIPALAWSSFADERLGLQLILPTGTAYFNQEVMYSMAQQASGNIVITLTSVESADLTPAQQQFINPGYTVIRVTAYADNQRITVFVGNISITVPWQGATPVEAGLLTEDGNFAPRPAEFNYANSTVTFTTDSLSVFVVRGAAVTAPLAPLMRFAVGVTVGDVTPFIDAATGRTMVPLRAVSEGLGADIGWDDTTRTVSITLGGQTAFVTIDAPLPGGMGTAVIQNDRTFVPVRYVSEVLGAEVRWDETNRAVYIY